MSIILFYNGKKTHYFHNRTVCLFPQAREQRNEIKILFQILPRRNAINLFIL